MNLKKISALLLVICMLMSALVACKSAVNLNDGTLNSKNTQDYPIEINGVTVSSKPDKVAVLSASLADVIVALGYEGSLVLGSDDITQPELDSLEKVRETDTETIIARGTSMVITESMDEATIETLKSSNIQVVQIKLAENRTDFERLYSEMGSVLNGASTGYAHAIEVARSIFTSLDDISRIVPISETVITAAMILDLDGHAITGEMLGDTLITYVGMSNVFQGSTADSLDLSQLSIADPQYIFCPADVKNTLETDSTYANLSAVKNGKVFEVSKDLMTLNGRTIITCATEIAGFVYPELLTSEDASVDLPEELIDDKDYSDLLEESVMSEVSTAIEYTDLVIGENNADILKMQDRLFELGYLTTDEYDGYYGDATTQAVKDYQKAVGLEQNGVADSKTLESLYSEDAPKVTTEE